MGKELVVGGKFCFQRDLLDLSHYPFNTAVLFSLCIYVPLRNAKLAMAYMCLRHNSVEVLHRHETETV